MLLVAGRRTNLFAEGYELGSASSNPRLPVSNLCNGDPSLPAAAEDATSPWDLILDGRLKDVTDPHFDSVWTVAPEGWSKIGSNIARDTTVKDGGVASVRFDYAGTGTPESIYRSIDVACGSLLDFTCSMRREALARGPQVVVMCRNTGLFWDGLSGAWVPDLLAVAFDGNALADDTWGTVGTTVTVPNLNDTDVATLEIVLRPLTHLDFPNAKNWVDDLRVQPQASLLSIHHPRNVAGAIITLDTSPDQTTWTTRATITGSSAAREAFASFSAVSARWWRLRLAVPALWGGTGLFDSFPAPPAIGEAVLALARSFVGTWRKADDAWDVPQVRAGQAGRYRQAQAGGPYRKVTLQRMGATGADWGLVLNRLYLTSLGGVRPSVLVWDESTPSRVVLGAIEPGLQLPFDVAEPNVPHTLTITGFAPPIWTS